MKRVIRFLSFVPLILFLIASIAMGMIKGSKKIIEIGWDIPYPEYIRNNIRDMEKKPFDGIVVRLEYKGGYVFNSKMKWDEIGFQKDISALRETNWQQFTDNFIKVSASYAMVDWFSDEDWESVMYNSSLCARIAKIVGLQGFLFDPEPYDINNPWDYTIQTHAASKSFEEYEKIVRKRGAQFVSAIQKEMPNIRLLTLFQLSHLGPLLKEQDIIKIRENLKNNIYGLLPAFLNGMLDAAEQNITIIDGNEAAYWYSQPLHFYEGFHQIQQKALLLIAPENLKKYKSQLRVGQALYVDLIFGYNPKGLAPTLTPKERAEFFEQNVYYALLTTDEYVWCYSEKMDWWKGENIPSGCEEAIIKAKAKIDGVVVEEEILVPILEYKFNEIGVYANSTGAASTPLLLETAEGPKDLHSGDGLGVSGLRGDRAFDNTKAPGMGIYGGDGYGRARHEKDDDSIDGLRSFTLQGWFMTASDTPICQAARLLQNTGDFLLIGAYKPSGGTNGSLGFSLTKGNDYPCSSSKYISTKTWVFFAITYDGTSSFENVKFYMGRKEQPVELVSKHTIVDDYPRNQSGLLALGALPPPEPPKLCFQGFLDNIRIFGSKFSKKGVLRIEDLEAIRKGDILNK